MKSKVTQLKKLIPLLVITLFTAISWSSCANNKITNAATIYALSYPIAEYSLVSPLLSERETSDSQHFPQAKVVKEHNRFFELSIIFNEKLQHFLAKFTRSEDKTSDIVKNSIPSYNQNQAEIEACKTST